MRSRLEAWWRYPFAVAGPLSLLVWTATAVAGVVGALTLRPQLEPIPALLVGFVLYAWITSARTRFTKSRGITLLERGLTRNPTGWRRSFALYNLACAEALLDNREAALQHLSTAAEEPYFRRYARKDPGLASIRDDPRFRAAVSR